MEQLKPKGITNEEYEKVQKIRLEQDFQFSTNQRIQNIQFEVARMSKCISDCISKQGSVEVDHKTEINAVMNSTMSSLKQFRQELGDIQTELNASERNMKLLKDQLDQCINISTFNQKMSEFNQFIERYQLEKQEMKKHFKEVIDQVTSDFRSKLKIQRDEILSIPSDLPRLEKLMNQKIELVELNGQNSVLRSSNNEKQIMLVERKLDNIYQQIKKLELINQEKK